MMTIETLRAMLADVVKASVEHVQAVKSLTNVYELSGCEATERALVKAVTEMQAASLDFCVEEWCKAAGLPTTISPA